jgi:hypothetical protein
MLRKRHAHASENREHAAARKPDSRGTVPTASDVRLFAKSSTYFALPVVRELQKAVPGAWRRSGLQVGMSADAEPSRSFSM